MPMTEAIELTRRTRGAAFVVSAPILAAAMAVSALISLAQVLYEFSWKGGMVLLVWAGADYALQSANYERSMRMSKQEVRDEHRDLEGNPATKGRIKRRFREMRRRKMMRQVARATVVITNPDEFAVALEYVLEPFVPRVVVLSPAEIPPVVSVQSLGVVQ
jgi:flagellar biosynthesis protein FlhB